MAEVIIGRILPIFKGNWSERTTYQKLDIVYYGGKSYVSQYSNNTNNNPASSDRWQIVVDSPSADDIAEEFEKNIGYVKNLDVEADDVEMLINIEGGGLLPDRDLVVPMATTTTAGIIRPTDKQKINRIDNIEETLGHTIADLATLERKVDNLPSGGNAIFDADAARLMAIVLRNLAYASNQEGQDAARLLIDMFENIDNRVSSLEVVWVGGIVYIGHTLTNSDFKVTATYTDGHKEVVDSFTMNKTTLSSTSNAIIISYGGKSVTTNVTALYNNPVEFVSVVSTQKGKAVGEAVDLSKITYTIRYQSGDIVENTDPNVITATPNTLQNEGDNEITISLDGYNISKSIIIPVGGIKEVLIETEKKSYPTIEGSGTKSIVLEYPTDSVLTSQPKYINVNVEPYEGATLTATMLRGVDLTYNDATESWEGTIKTGSSASPTNRTPTTIIVENITNEDGGYTGIKMKFQYTINTTLYSADWRTTLGKYIIDIKTYIP